MPSHHGRVAVWTGVISLVVLTVRAHGEEQKEAKLPPASEAQVDFVRDIQPIFQRTCYSCHGPEKQEGGLRLDSRQRALDGGDSGKIFVKGMSADSRLIQLVAGLDSDLGAMPPEGEGTPLTAQQV